MFLKVIFLLSFFLRGNPLRIGTSGRTRNEPSGRFPEEATLETRSHADEAKFAKESADRSSWERSDSFGRSAEKITVNSCTTLISGQIRNTGAGGVMRVGKKLENALFVVGPTP
mmetsp:Transcript_27888/g.55912  ORF Transcript_27888/g.55912 Transcript_27888/m.55912 type:complete len:114 (-) Transcript_27888:402-743(-)